MIVCAIDVGIRNLALCILEKGKSKREGEEGEGEGGKGEGEGEGEGKGEKENKKEKESKDWIAAFSEMKILLWDVYDITETDNIGVKERCTHLKKDGSPCNACCKFTSNDVPCCKSHFPKEVVFDEKIHAIKPASKVSKMSMQQLTHLILKKVSTLYEENKALFDSLTICAIELQMNKNGNMRFVSHVLFAKLCDIMLHKNGNLNTTVKFVNASFKLKVYDGPPIACVLKGEYAKRKWLSQRYVEWYLDNRFTTEQRDRWVPIFKTKASADMSDTLLMTLNECNKERTTKKPPLTRVL
jgi:hypothetical protein